MLCLLYCDELGEVCIALRPSPDLESRIKGEYSNSCAGDVGAMPAVTFPSVPVLTCCAVLCCAALRCAMLR